MSDYQAAKVWLAEAVGLSKDAMHMSIGLLVFLLAIAIFRARPRDAKPLLAVIVVALLGEAWDHYDAWNTGQRLRWDLAWHDLWVTCLWPALLCAVARWTKLLR